MDRKRGGTGGYRTTKYNGTLTVAPDLLALVVERGTLAHVTVTVVRAARAAVLFVHVRGTLAGVAGAVFWQVALVVGRPAQRPDSDELLWTVHKKKKRNKKKMHI